VFNSRSDNREVSGSKTDKSQGLMTICNYEMTNTGNTLITRVAIFDNKTVPGTFVPDESVHFKHCTHYNCPGESIQLNFIE
jgi:hypothetical protein